MKLHIFNPEHDMALAANDPHFTAPHAGRDMRADLGFLPALWADDGDAVLVDNAEAAREKARHLKGHAADVRFVERNDVKQLDSLTGIDPWGWDSTLRCQLASAGVDSRLLPDDNVLRQTREVSNRGWAATHLLPALQMEATTGRTTIVKDVEDVDKMIADQHDLCLKAPWSCSGRGVRFVDKETWQERGRQWAANVIRRQGSLTVEPVYDKVEDFGMEFEMRDGQCCYRGLSLFKTINGAYAGNIIATERAKREMMSRYVDLSLLDNLAKKAAAIMQPVLHGFYQGPFGIDMMLVRQEGSQMLLVHPCVELNLRRTMGHVALQLSPTENDPQALMRVDYSNGYHFRIISTRENVVDKDVF